MLVNKIDTLQYNDYIYETLLQEFQGNIGGVVQRSEEFKLLLYSLVYYFSTTSKGDGRVVTFGNSITGTVFSHTSKWKLYVIEILVARYLVNKISPLLGKRVAIMCKILDISNYVKLLLSREMASYLTLLHRCTGTSIDKDTGIHIGKVYQMWNFYEIEDIATYLKFNYILESYLNADNVSWLYVKWARSALKKRTTSGSSSTTTTSNKIKGKCPECGQVPYNVQYSECCNVGYCYYCKCKNDEYNICKSC